MSGVPYKWSLPATNRTADEIILNDLMSEYGQSVWDYAFALTQNRSTSDDLTQETFLKAYQNLGTFRHDASPKTWLFKIARNVTHDHFRSNIVRRLVLFGTVKPKEQVPSAEQEAVEHIVREEIWRAVFQLSPKLREVLVLYGYEDLSIQEIAEVLRISQGTVKSRLHRARQRLSERMEGGRENGE